MEWRNKTVMITGAAGGLGKALCRAFGKRGAKIIAVDLDAEGLRGLLSDGFDMEIIQCDLTDEATCSGRLSVKAVDLLINNAGITHFSRFAETAPATIRRVIEVNFLAAVNVTKAVLPALIESRGMIVAVSSVAGFSPLYGRSGYSASKHAMLGFFDSLRTELEDDGVGVMVVCPSFIATQSVVRQTGAESMAARPGSASQTSGVPLSPEGVAEAIVGGVGRGRRLLVVGRLGKLAYWINKLSPRLYARLMVRKMKPELSIG